MEVRMATMDNFVNPTFPTPFMTADPLSTNLVTPEGARETVKAVKELPDRVLEKTFKGIVQAKMVKIIKFLFFDEKVSSGMGALRPKILWGLAALEPPKNGRQRGGKGGFFFSFSIENQKENGKNMLYIL